MREQDLIHRACYILVFNPADELFIQRRTMTKDVFPGYLDVAAGGVVLAGESYPESAERELEEELGVTVNGLEFLFAHYYEDDKNRVWGHVFRCTHPGPFTLQEEEVEDGWFLSLPEIFALSEKEPFTPDGLEILRRLTGMAD